MKHRTGLHHGKVATLAAVTVMAFTMLTGVAFAADDESTATLTGGVLNIKSALVAGTFAGTLNGTAKTLDGVGFSGFTIEDPSGSGDGWNVVMQATLFVNGTTPGKDIAANAFTAPLFGVTGNAGSSAVPGTLHAAAPIDTGIAGVEMVRTSAAGQGMGTYDFTADASAWKLALTADEYAGSYTSTVTTTLATNL